MEISELCGVLEAILYVAGEPVNAEALAHALNLTRTELEPAIEQLRESCLLDKRGIRLNRHGGDIQLSINPEYAMYVEMFLQPVTKSEIEAVRGVKCDYSVQLLLARGLIEEQGHRETLGRPILYGTTDKFLRHFGLEGLGDLPEEKQNLSEGEVKV